MNFSRSAPAPLDQADGLRRLFARAPICVVPVVSNPHMAFGGVLLERVCTAFAEHGAQVVVVDASERAPAPHEVSLMELREGIEPLSPSVSYLAARGLLLRYVDTHGSTANFVNHLTDAAPTADVILIHASAIDHCRLLGRSVQERSLRSWAMNARPLLLVDDRPSSVTHAYASLKLLTQRAEVMVHDILLGASDFSPRAPRIAEQLRSCAEHFLGAVVRDVLLLDPASDPHQNAPADMRRWAHDCLKSPSGPGRYPVEEGGAYALTRPLVPARAELNS
jgi:NAD(P)-dependent dehydrogenase (short-subunit alcohol dehydrogenase family)